MSDVKERKDKKARKHSKRGKELESPELSPVRKSEPEEEEVDEDQDYFGSMVRDEFTQKFDQD